MSKLGRGGGEAVHRAVPSAERADSLVRTVLMASPEDQTMAEEDWLESTPRPAGLALGMFVATIFSTNGSILGGAMSKINRDKWLEIW